MNEKHNRRIAKDIDTSVIFSMREQGMSNKQIADKLGVSCSTIYRYAGRKSQQVKYAEVQNKPCPVPNPVNYIPNTDPFQYRVNRDGTICILPEEPQKVDVPEPVAEMEPITPVPDYTIESTVSESAVAMSIPESKIEPILKVVSTRSTLEGYLCKYIVDTSSGSVEMSDGTISGLLDRETIARFIRELKEIAKMLDIQEV